MSSAQQQQTVRLDMPSLADMEANATSMPAHNCMSANDCMSANAPASIIHLREQGSDSNFNNTQHSPSDTMALASLTSSSFVKTSLERSPEQTPKRLAVGGELDETKPKSSDRATSYRTNNNANANANANVNANADGKADGFNIMRLAANESDQDEDTNENNEEDDIQVPATDVSLMQLRNESATGTEGRKVYDEIAESLHDFGLVSKLEYRDMEKHYTSCFSGPVGFIVYCTHRTLTWRPMPFSNQECYDILGVDMSSDNTKHVVQDLSTLELMRDLMSTSSSENMIYISNVYANCIDEFGKPIRKLVDLWIPVIKFNQDEAVALMALHNTVTLLRQPGIYPPESD